MNSTSVLMREFRSRSYAGNMIVNRIKGILGFILALIKRSLCCFRRRRKSSADIVPLTDIGIVPNYQTQNNSGPELGSWNSWDDPSAPRQPQTIEEHIEHYRSSRAAAMMKQEPEEPQPDYFQDMEPKIKRQLKMMVKRKENTQSSILAYAPDDVVPMDSGELKSWEEVENREGDWAEGADRWTMGDALRQSRREEKMKKHMEKESRRMAVS